MNTQFISQVKLKTDQVASYQSYPFSLAAVRHLKTLKLHQNVTFFIGENGSGKSTLLEAIATSWGFNPEGGTRNFGFGTRASHSNLHQYIRLVKGITRPLDGFFFRAESFFNVATEIERLDSEPSFGPPIIDSYGSRSLHEQSHGESFLALMMNRFSSNGLYLLDEPEAALSPQRQLAVLCRIHDLVQKKSQFIIVTHSPILLAYPNAYIYEFTGNGIKLVNYYDTEQYRVTHDFLVNPKRMLEILLETDPAT